MNNSSLNNPFQPQNLGLNTNAGIALSHNHTYTATQSGWIIWSIFDNTSTYTFTFNGFQAGYAHGYPNKWSDSNMAVVYVVPGDTYSCTGANVFSFYPLKGA